VEVLSSALRHGIDGADIQHALVHALAVDESGEDPLRYLVLGPDRAANLLELLGAGSHERAGGHSCDADAEPVPTTVAGRQVIEMAGKRKASAGALDQARVEALAAEAERGYDFEEILRRRRGGRPALGSARPASSRCA
jgi:hypothetical protein